MMRAKPLIIWCLAGRAIALSVSRRTFAIGTAAAPFAAYADVPAQTYDGLYVVEGSKSRRRVVTRDGAVVVEAEEDGRWRALESSADSDGLLVAGKRGVFESARNSAVLDCMVKVTYPADSIRWSDGERWVRKRVLYPKT